MVMPNELTHFADDVVNRVKRCRPIHLGCERQSVLEFIDAGYSGSSLVRPALERLRDVAAAGGLDRLSVHCPDRLARH
jgi:site-specific DNA recombinase